MNPRGWRLGRIGGVAITADPSLLIIAVLLSFNLWAAFSDPGRFPGLGGGAAVGLSLATTTLFLLSILAHELAHAGVFRAKGIPVRGITLYLFGGATEATREAARPLDEFLVSAAGPATTAALGTVFLALHAFGSGFLPEPIRVGMFGPLALANILMAGFNLLPGYPLDGGQMLRAVVWRVTGDRARATRVAARAGQVVAGAIIALGIALGARAQMQGGDALFGLWPVLIGWFLLRAASSAVSVEKRRRLLETTTAGQVMSPPPPVVPAELPVSVVMERYLAGHDGEAFPVVQDGHVAGFVSLRTARAVPLDRPVREAMAGAQAVVEVTPAEPMKAVGERMRERGTETAMVLDGGRLVGVIEPEDLIAFVRGRRGAPRAPRAGTPAANP